jgi:hypothetical protein
VLRGLLTTLHDSLNHQENETRSIICDKCGVQLNSTDKVSTLFMNGEKFSFCSITCVIKFSNAIGEIERLVHAIDYGASNLKTTVVGEAELANAT